MNPNSALAAEVEVASPCINVCRMNDATGWCEGCRRTLEEIACWSIYTPAEKRAVLAQLPTRQA
jgi:predicted Fe-S protein YdhL (DUF1289 family)